MAEYRLEFEADSGAAERSIFNLRKSIKEVTKEFEKSEIGAEDFVAAASEISKLKKEYNDARNAVANIDKAYRDLNKAIEANFAVHTKAVSAASKYHKDVLQLAEHSAKEEDRLRNKNFQAEQNDWDRRLKLAVAAKNKIAAQEKAIMEFRAGMAGRGAIPAIASPIRGGADIMGSPDFLQPLSLGRLENRLTKLKEEARRISPVGEKWEAVNKEVIQLERGIERIQKRQRLGPTAGQRASAAGGAFLYGGGMGGGLGSALGGVAGGLMGGVPGAFTGAAIGQVADNLGTALAGITSQASKVQQLQRGLALASIDAKDFAEAQAAVADVSTRLFIPLEQVTKSFSQLRVNTKQYGLSVEETKQILEGTILAVSAFGGSADDVDGAMRAVVQILSKGSVQAEELRGQLGERFPGAVIKFAQANKLSFDELQDRLKEGSIGIKEFVTFAKKNYEDYAAFSEKLATAPEFAGRRLQIALEQISLEIGGLFGPMGAGIQDLLTSTINNIAQFIKENRGYLRQMISDFSSIVGPIAKVFIELMKVIANFSVQVGKIFQGLFAGIRQALGMASIGEAKARLDKAKAATAGKTRPTRNARGGGTTTSAEFLELEAAQRAFSGLGGQAAFNKANAPAQPSDLIFGGPGAGVSMLAGAADRDKEAKKKQQSLESYHSLQDQLAKNFTQDQLDRMEQEYQAEVNKINSAFDLREARANSFQKEAIRFERQMSDIELKRQKALLDASADVIRAQGSVAGGAGANLTGGGGFSTAQLQKASSEASKFTGIANMCSESVKAFYKSLGISLSGVTAWADTVRKAGKTMTDWSKLQAGDIVATGRPGDTPHVGVYTGGNNVFHQSRKRGLKAGNYPDLDYFKSGYFVRPNAMDAGAPRKVTGDEKRDVIADQKAQLAMAQQSLTVRLADAQAVREAAVAWAQYSASIVPIEEQALQNDILSKKNELVKASLPEDVIEKELKYFEAQQKTTLAIAENNELLANGTINQKEHAKRLLELQTRLAGYNTELDRNIQLQRQQSFDASMGALQKQITMATPIGGTGLAAGFIGDAGSKYEEAIKEGRSQDEATRFAELQNQLTLLETRNGAVKSSVLAIGDAFATAMTTGVSGLIDGTATAQEVFANFLKSVADALMQAAQQMIATYIAIGIAKLFAGMGGGGGLGAGGAGFGGSNSFSSFNAGGAQAFSMPSLMAEGGFVSGPTSAIIGEGGESEYVIPSSKMESAMARYSRGARGESVIAGSGGGGEGGAVTAAAGPMVVDVRYNVERINEVEYVTASQFQAGMRQAAQQGAAQGEQRTLRRLQQSPGTRKRVGM